MWAEEHFDESRDLIQEPRIGVSFGGHSQGWLLVEIITEVQLIWSTPGPVRFLLVSPDSLGLLLFGSISASRTQSPKRGS